MKAIDIIKKSISEINKQLKKNEEISADKNFEILGPKSNLDSVLIVNFFVSIEEKTKTLTGKDISLLTDDFFGKSYKAIIIFNFPF